MACMNESPKICFKCSNSTRFTNCIMENVSFENYTIEKRMFVELAIMCFGKLIYLKEKDKAPINFSDSDTINITPEGLLQ